MTDFKKKRYDRLEKNFVNMFCGVLEVRDPNHIDVARTMVHEFVKDLIEVGKSLPNKNLKGNFFGVIKHDGDLMKLEDFQAHCRDSFFVDYDGYGHPVGIESGFFKGDGAPLRMDPNVTVIPSECDDVPEGTTHVIWFNR
jgi:hypothetical protein